MFIPGTPEVDVNNDGTWGTTARASIQTNLTAWLNYLEAESIQMVLFHADNDEPTKVQALTLAPLIANQRDRLR